MVNDAMKLILMLAPVILALTLPASAQKVAPVHALATNTSNQPLNTPDGERLAMIAFLKRNYAKLNNIEITQAAAALEPGVKIFALGTDNETNTADVLAIGKKRWDAKFANGKNFAQCFSGGGKRAAANYPQFDVASNSVLTLEAALNKCLQANNEIQLAIGDAWTMGALAAYLRSLADNVNLTIRVSSVAARERFDAGRAQFLQRRGQQNFACASCHVQHAGAIYGQSGLSAAVGQASNMPVLWAGGKLRSVQRQFQVCMERSGALPLALGSTAMNDLEYYHAFLSTGLPIQPLSARR
jgi:L-cysteine S-thiosulfotransferase